MAQNEIQKYYTGQNFYDAVRQPLNTFYENHDRLEKLSNFLNSAEATDYPNIPAGTLAEMGQLRAQVNTYIAASDTVDMLNKAKEFIRI